mgnify:CR=1 FL=1
MKSIFIFWFSIFIINAYSCSCDTPSFSSASEYVDEIFLGDIVKQEMIYESKKMWNGIEYQNKHIETTFKVEKKWKGNSDMYITLQQESTCATPLEIQRYRPYIIYAVYEIDTVFGFTFQRKLHTYACTRNASSAVFSKYNEGDWDDRPELNNKYSLIKLRNNKFDYHIFLAVVISLSLLLLIFQKRKKFLNKK